MLPLFDENNNHNQKCLKCHLRFWNAHTNKPNSRHDFCREDMELYANNGLSVGITK